MKNKAYKTLFILVLSTLLQPTILGQLVDVKSDPSEADQKEAVDYDLTDQQRFESQQFVHEGLLQRQLKEDCDKLKDSKACYGNGKTKFLGVDSTMVQAVAKMYSLFGGMVAASGGGMDFGKKSASETPATEGAAEGEASTNESGTDTSQGNDQQGDQGGKKKNYCVYIPAAGETLAMFMQQMGQNDIMNGVPTETPQKDMLYKAARSHETRAKTAKIQGAVWGATAACYVTYMAAGGIALDWKVIAQAGAAGFLTIFWLNEAKQHEKYASEVKKIADNLPGKGDCNPHTQNDCYCTQPETQYDPTYCLPQLHKKAVANSSFRVPCVDKDLQADAKCDCVTKEACFDAEYFSKVSAPGFVQFAQSSAGRDFRALTRGELLNGRLASASNTNSSAAKKLLGDLSKKINNNKTLSKKDLATADAIQGLGVPLSLARSLASVKTTAAGKKRANAIASGAIGRGKTGKRTYRNKNGVLRFSKGLGKVGAGKRKSSTNFKSMLNKYKKKKGRKGSKVLKFANKAQKAAQIEKNKDKPIFEIISRRYQVSGWRRLEIQ